MDRTKTHAPAEHEWDVSARAEGVLDAVLDQTSDVQRVAAQQQAPISGELKKQKVLMDESGRLKSRVLFITNDVGVCTADSAAAREYTDLETVFDEVHVLVLGRPGVVPDTEGEAIRLATHTWAYPLAPRFFFMTPYAARSYVSDALTFTDGFRPDLIVAREPFEAAAAGVFIANKFERLLQVHATDDVWLNEERFLAADKLNKRRLRFLRFALKRADSLRAGTTALKEALQKLAPKKLDDIAILPRYFRTRELLALPREPEQKLFSQFVFTLLAIGEMNAQSTLFRVLDAARMALQTPTIGLVLLGDGPLKQQFRDRAQLLGIAKQVLFRGKVEKPVDELRSADVLVMTDTDTASDELVLQAAALGVPLIMAKNQLRTDLFVDGRDALLCDPEDTLCFTKAIRKFLNTNALRVQFSTNGREIVRTRIEEDPEVYRRALRDSIEYMLYRANLTADAAAAATTAQAVKPAVVDVDGIAMRVPEEMRG